MNYKVIANFLSQLLIMLGLGMCISAGLAYYYDEEAALSPMIICSVSAVIPSLLIYFFTRGCKKEQLVTELRESYASVSLGWLLATAFGCLPFILIGQFTLPDALFEAAAGLTTTGASVISEKLMLSNGELLLGGLESLPKSLLFWRSLLNWYGGMGIVFFALLLMPIIATSNKSLLYNAEVPGLKTDSSQLTPRVKDSVLILSGIYTFLTIASCVVYRLTGIDTWFDALCHAFSTVSTGGFSSRNASLGAYPSPLLHWAVIFFMFLSACNFTLILQALKGHFTFWKDEEFRFFAYMILGATLIVAGLIWFERPEGLPMTGAPDTILPRGLEYYLRLAAFHVVSLASTTGLAISDYDAVWNIPAVRILLFLLMFPAGCGGSTSGGMKCSRLIVLFKHVRYEVRSCLFPHAVCDIRLSGERVPMSIVSRTLAFATIYVFILFAVATCIMFMEDAPTLSTAFGSAFTCLSNVGPGFGKTGPCETFGWFIAPTKNLLSLTMIAGRLELFTLCVLFLPSFWKK